MLNESFPLLTEADIRRQVANYVFSNDPVPIPPRGMIRDGLEAYAWWDRAGNEAS